MITDYFVSAQRLTSILYKLMISFHVAIWCKREAFKITCKIDHFQGVLKVYSLLF